LTHKQRLGKWGETEARRYLEAKTYVFIEKNFRVPEGEIDLVMQDGDIIVFIEVNTRTSDRFGAPEESVSWAKRKRLLRAAWAFLQERERVGASWRIDVVAIEASPNWTIQRLDHYQSAFEIDFNNL
jgi:putative endonuclease